jgi:hypothetical protein
MPFDRKDGWTLRSVKHRDHCICVCPRARVHCARADVCVVLHFLRVWMMRPAVILKFDTD